MPLVTVNIPESTSNSILAALNRIAAALERISGPIVEVHPSEPATLKDYAVVTPEDAQQIKEAEMDFAQRHMLVPGSPAYFAAIAEFESKVAEAYGEDAVEQLPWRAKIGPRYVDSTSAIQHPSPETE